MVEMCDPASMHWEAFTDILATGIQQARKSLDDKSRKTSPPRRKVVHSSFDVRAAGVCVIGRHGPAVAQIKTSLAALIPPPPLPSPPLPLSSTLSSTSLALESFHVKRPDDVTDGALLVPKIVLVAVHCPGVKVIDDAGDKGQLDDLYDEVCNVGADALVFYVDLPPALYPPLRLGLYHPEVARLLLPSQPALRALALQHCLLTVTQGSGLNLQQEGVVRDWLARPVTPLHPVFGAARRMRARALEQWGGCHPPLSSSPSTVRDTRTTQRSTRSHLDTAATFVNEAFRRGTERDTGRDMWRDAEGFIPATEAHPLVDSRGGRWGGRRGGGQGARRSYGTLERSRRVSAEDRLALVPLKGQDEGC